MIVPAQRNLTARKALFSMLLTFIVGAAGYAIVSSRPWTVPESAKQLKNPIQPSDAALESARSVYSEKCANCHGDTGRGDGHDASLYGPAPTNFTDNKLMSATTDGELFYKLTEGHRPMPSFKKRLTEEQRWRLVLLLRSFTTQTSAPGQSSTSAPSPAAPHP
jgi:mono/diheme cytochrome c family protein